MIKGRLFVHVHTIKCITIFSLQIKENKNYHVIINGHIKNTLKFGFSNLDGLHNSTISMFLICKHSTDPPTPLQQMKTEATAQITQTILLRLLISCIKQFMTSNRFSKFELMTWKWTRKIRPWEDWEGFPCYGLALRHFFMLIQVFIQTIQLIGSSWWPDGCHLQPIEPGISLY